MTDAPEDCLRSIVTRIERLATERRGLRKDIRDIFHESELAGFRSCPVCIFHTTRALCATLSGCGGLTFRLPRRTRHGRGGRRSSKCIGGGWRDDRL